MTAPESVPVKPPPPYATYIPLRSPIEDYRFKPHNTLGQAKNAALNQQSCYSSRKGFLCDMVIYVLDGDTYVPWLRLTQGTSRNDYPELAARPPSKRQQQYRAEFAAQVAASYQEEADRKRAEAEALLAELEP